MPEEQWRAGGAVGVIVEAWLLGSLRVGSVVTSAPGSSLSDSYERASVASDAYPSASAVLTACGGVCCNGGVATACVKAEARERRAGLGGVVGTSS
jgi:hypothetical protein